jgi:hypothetical protein
MQGNVTGDRTAFALLSPAERGACTRKRYLGGESLPKCFVLTWRNGLGLNVTDCMLLEQETMMMSE